MPQSTATGVRTDVGALGAVRVWPAGTVTAWHCITVCARAPRVGVECAWGCSCCCWQRSTGDLNKSINININIYIYIYIYSASGGYWANTRTRY